MNFQTILIFLTLLSGILTDPGDRSQVGDQRRPLTGGDATPSRKRAAPSGGDSTPQKQRFASGNATPSRQRLEEDVLLPRKRPASPGADPSSPRHRLAGGDTASYRQKGDSGPPRRPPSSGGDASPQRRFANSGGDASPPKRSLSFEGDANPSRRLSSSEKDASQPRRPATSRRDVSPPRSHPSSPNRVETSSRRLSITLEREQSTSRQRPTSSRPANSAGDEYSLKQRPTITAKDESLQRSRSTNSVRDESLSRQPSTNYAREESLSIQQFLDSMGDKSPSKQWSASADGNASPSRRRERVEESKKTSEFPMESTMSQKKEKLMELGNMRDDMEKMQEEIVGMLKDLFWSSNLTGDDMEENSLNAKSRETLQAILKDGIQQITAKSDEFIHLVDKTKALIKNAGAPGNSAEAAKNIKSLHKMKTDITAMNENYMRKIEKNLKGMIEMEKSAIGEKAVSLGSSSIRGQHLSFEVIKGSTRPRGEKKATSMSQPESPTPQRTGTPKRKNSSRE